MLLMMVIMMRVRVAVIEKFHHSLALQKVHLQP